MRTFTERPKATWQNISSEPAMSVRARRPEAVSGSAASDRPGHDFSRIPVHAKASVKLQSKLAVNAPDDIYEQEADHVSKQLMRMPEPLRAGREEERVRPGRVGLSESGQSAAPPTVDEVLASPGRPLDPAARAFFEPRFGYDFSRVRVHTDGQAAQSARDVKARAYTVGQHVVFGAGEYAPGTNAGNRLLAHELTHTVQQGDVVARGQAHAPTTLIQRTPDDTPTSGEPQTAAEETPSKQDSTFDPSCNAARQMIIGLVLKKTQEMLDRAEARMSILVTGVKEGTDKDYITWFGTFDESRARYVIQTYRLISEALAGGVDFTCDCDGTEYAHVFPWFKRRIHLCPPFWSAPYSGLDSKPGTIIHELAHEVLRGGDFRYPVDKAKELAVNSPWLAVRNANNLEYFAESV